MIFMNIPLIFFLPVEKWEMDTRHVFYTCWHWDPKVCPKAQRITGTQTKFNLKIRYNRISKEFPNLQAKLIPGYLLKVYPQRIWKVYIRIKGFIRKQQQLKSNTSLESNYYLLN